MLEENRYSTCFLFAENASYVKRDGKVPGKVKRTISASGSFSLSLYKASLLKESSVNVERGQYFIFLIN